jgi:hypothetical protein
MPTSTYSHIPMVIKFLELAMPSSLLDIGLGNGKIGFLARDLLDTMLGQRYKKEEWKIRIDGVEVFPDYIQDFQKAIYDNIFIGDAFDVIDTLDSYDLIFLGDVLEHFEKKALKFLDKCITHCNQHLILAIPLGDKWIQPEIYGNPHKEHKSFWERNDFEPLAFKSEYLNFPNLGLYGVFLIEKQHYLKRKIIDKADDLFEKGRKSESFLYAEKKLSEYAPGLENKFFLVDLLVNSERIDEAIDRLMKAKEKFPGESSVIGFIKQLQRIGQKDEQVK